MSPEELQDGEQILLIDQRGRRHLVSLKKGETFHSDRGWIPHDALIGRPEGVTVRSSLGLRYLAVRPTLAEYILEMPRGAQVIYPKDLALILFWADIAPGQTVLEAGTGSGALTLALLRAVGSGGRVISYEAREDFARRAQRNLEARLGPTPTLTLRLRDIYEGIEERGLDRVILDLPEPWRVVPVAAVALRPGGIFCAYVPTILQAQRVHEALAGYPAFALPETFETLLRPWQIQGLSVRPFHRMVAHTGFLTLARRVLAREGPAFSPDEVVEPSPPVEPSPGALRDVSE